MKNLQEIKKAATIILLIPALQFGLFALCFYEQALFFIFQLAVYVLFLFFMHFKTKNLISSFIANPKKLPGNFTKFNTLAYTIALVIGIVFDDYPKYIGWDYIMMFSAFIILLLVVPIATYIITKIYVELTIPFLRDIGEEKE